MGVLPDFCLARAFRLTDGELTRHTCVSRKKTEGEAMAALLCWQVGLNINLGRKGNGNDDTERSEITEYRSADQRSAE